MRIYDTVRLIYIHVSIQCRENARGVEEMKRIYCIEGPVLSNTSSAKVAFVTVAGVYCQDMNSEADVKMKCTLLPRTWCFRCHIWLETNQTKPVNCRCVHLLWALLSEKKSRRKKDKAVSVSPQKDHGIHPWSARTASFLSSNVSSCLKVTECLFHQPSDWGVKRHFLHNAPCAARGRWAFSQHRMCQESSGVWGVSERRSNTKICFFFHCPRIRCEHREVK